jgi:hypothetical protein
MNRWAMNRWLLPLLLAASPALAQPAIPDALRGAWFAGACAAPTATLYTTARAAVRLPHEGPARLLRFQSIGQQGEWFVGTAGGPEAPRLLLRAAGAALETAEPDAKLRDDLLPGESPRTSWRRCEAPPAGIAVRHGEGFAFLGTIETLEAACAGPFPRCAEALVAAADISGDRLVTAAEIARLLRGAAWVAAVQEGGTADTVLAVEGAGLVGGVLAARLLIESLDFDGDGRLSAAEIAQDRGALPAGGGAAAGRPLRFEALGAAAGFLRGLVEGIAGAR